MGFLLDTHVWIWSQASPGNLGLEATKVLTDPREALFVSTISTLELARLSAGKRIELHPDLESWVGQSLELLLASALELTHGIAGEAYRLPGEFHRDPADRILVATARLHHLTFLTADERILAYPHVETRDARR